MLIPGEGLQAEYPQAGLFLGASGEVVRRWVVSGPRGGGWGGGGEGWVTNTKCACEKLDVDKKNIYSTNCINDL